MAEYYMAMLQLIINCKHQFRKAKNSFVFLPCIHIQKIKKFFKTIFNIYFLVFNF